MERIRNNFEAIKDNLRKDKDHLHINVGYERMGKSNLSLIQALIVDPTFTADRIVFTPQEFAKAVYCAKQYQCIIADEGAEAFFNKDTMKQENKENMRTLTKIGRRNLCIIINVPDFFLLDSYIRGHRAKTLCQVFERGQCKGFNKAMLSRIVKDDKTRRTTYPDPPTFWDKFPDISRDRGKLGKLWKTYIKKKDKYLQGKDKKTELKEQLAKVTMRTYTQNELARALGVTQPTVSLMCKKLKVKTVTLLTGIKRIPETEMKRIIALQKKAFAPAIKAEKTAMARAQRKKEREEHLAEALNS
jgi:DNA-binding MarR family transcriptional regulator